MVGKNFSGMDRCFFVGCLDKTGFCKCRLQKVLNLHGGFTDFVVSETGFEQTLSCRKRGLKCLSWGVSSIFFFSFFLVHGFLNIVFLGGSAEILVSPSQHSNATGGGMQAALYGRDRRG